MCGHPILEYHHIIPYATDQHFRPADMMVLCPNHHDEATYGPLAGDQNQQRAHKAKPANVLSGRANGNLVFPPTMKGLSIGRTAMGITFPKAGPVLLSNRECILRIDPDDGGRMLISAILRDEANGVVASLTRNEWRSGGPIAWDIEFKYQWLKIRAANKKISLQIDVIDDWVYIEGELWSSGKLMELRKDGLFTNGSYMSGFSLDGGAISFNPVTGSRTLVPMGLLRPEAFLGPRLGRNQVCWCGSALKYKICHGIFG